MRFIGAMALTVLVVLIGGCGYYVGYQKRSADFGNGYNSGLEDGKKHGRAEVEATQSMLLEVCLSKADSSYPRDNLAADSKRDPVNSQRYLEYYDKIRKIEEDTCKLKYAS